MDSGCLHLAGVESITGGWTRSMRSAAVDSYGVAVSSESSDLQ
jgi:hypothetical protein